MMSIKSCCSNKVLYLLLILLLLLILVCFGHAASFVPLSSSTRNNADATCITVQWTTPLVKTALSVRSSIMSDAGTCGHDDNGDDDGDDDAYPVLPLNNNNNNNMAEYKADDTAASSSSSISQRRRSFLIMGVMTTSSFLMTPFQHERYYKATAVAATDTFYQKYTESSTSTELVAGSSGLLDSRVTENVLSPPPYGMEVADIFYPFWFAGTWNVQSIGTDVQAPCGVDLFTGGNKTLIKAKNEMGQILKYQSRFLPASTSTDKDTQGSSTTAIRSSSSTNRYIADREYNIKSIAKSAMGENSVVDINTMSSPNKISCILALQGAPSLLRVDLITLQRREEEEDVSDDDGSISSLPRFDCSEVVREIVAPIGKNNNNNNGPAAQSSSSQTTASVILKEVETTSLYTYDKIKDEIHCRQRSATFLLPSQQNPMAMKMWEVARGRPVDVRFYNVLYTRPATTAAAREASKKRV